MDRSEVINYIVENKSLIAARLHAHARLSETGRLALTDMGHSESHPTVIAHAKARDEFNSDAETVDYVNGDALACVVVHAMPERIVMVISELLKCDLRSALSHVDR